MKRIRNIVFNKQETNVNFGILKKIEYPDLENIKQLAISNSGLVFDPKNGRTFTLNETGLFILSRIKENKGISEILKEASMEYSIDIEEDQFGIFEFIRELNNHFK